MHFCGDENGSKGYILPDGLELRGILQTKGPKNVRDIENPFEERKDGSDDTRSVRLLWSSLGYHIQQRQVAIDNI